MNKRVTSFLCSCALLLVLIGRSASVPSSNLLGISPQDDVYYKALFSSPSSTVRCKDGSKKFTKSQLNDDFCDCPDGTDEPGTSACPSGTFYCQNAGHSPLAIFSSRVNDGICDCCDGSDEYNGKVNCSNTCWEAGKVARDKLKKKISTFQEGATLRKQEIEKAKVAIVKDEAELSKLKIEEKILNGLVQQLKEHKEQIEKAEEEERLKKEKEEKEKKEASEGQNKAVEEAVSQEKPIQSNEDKIGEASPSDQDLGESSKNSINEVEMTDTENSPNERLPENEGSTKKEEEAPVADESGHGTVTKGSTKKEEVAPVADESHPGTVTKEEAESENAETLSKEELGRLVASRWTGESTGQETREADAVKDNNNEISEEEPKDAHDEHYEGYDSEIEDDRPSYNDDEDEGNHSEDFEEENQEDSSSSFKSMSDDELDLSDITTSSNPSWLEKIQKTVKNILQAVKLFQTPVDLSEAAHVRKEYDDSSAKLSKIQSRISSLTEKLKHYFGPEKEFYSFYGKCFEIKQNKYVYKVCPFKQASQEEGYSRTGLGNWDKFEDSYKVMMFSGGDKCWNGPDRSLKVKLRCGLKNEVTDVGEPSRCEYEALLSTPALCQEQTLKELQEKLELMNKEQPKGHDEL